MPGFFREIIISVKDASRPNHTKTREKGMKKFAALLLALVMLVTLCACGSKDNAKNDDNKTMKVGLILGTGGLGDKNFNDMA